MIATSLPHCVFISSPICAWIVTPPPTPTCAWRFAAAGLTSDVNAVSDTTSSLSPYTCNTSGAHVECSQLHSGMWAAGRNVESCLYIYIYYIYIYMLYMLYIYIYMCVCKLSSCERHKKSYIFATLCTIWKLEFLHAKFGLTISVRGHSSVLHPGITVISSSHLVSIGRWRYIQKFAW